jgi:hypothetical protein
MKIAHRQFPHFAVGFPTLPAWHAWRQRNPTVHGDSRFIRGMPGSLVLHGMR